MKIQKSSLCWMLFFLGLAGVHLWFIQRNELWRGLVLLFMGLCAGINYHEMFFEPLFEFAKQWRDEAILDWRHIVEEKNRAIIELKRELENRDSGEEWKQAAQNN